MRKVLFSMIVVTLVLSVALVGYVAEEKLVWDKSWPTRIAIGAAPIGGGFYMGASCLANVLKEEFPQLEIIVEQTKASVHNLKLIDADEVEFAMCTTDTAFEGWIGQGPFEGVAHKGVRIFMPAWPNPLTFVALKKDNITNIHEFTGKYSGISKGSATDVFVMKTVETFNIPVEVININIADTVQALKNGIISGYSLGHPNTATQDLAMQADIRVFGITGEDAEKFVKLRPEYTYPLTIPGGYYKGSDEPFDAVGFYDILIVRDDLPEDMVYTVLKAMYKHQDIIKATWPLFAEGMGPEYVRVLSAPMHKGSIKYYKELGIEIPEAAILDE